MIEVQQGLFVGSQHDYEFTVARQTGWAVVHACKEPYHRQALGYSGRAAPKDHPEYFRAQRGNRLILNLVDANNPLFFNREQVITPALDFIDEGLGNQLQVLVHCNQGESRAPSIALLYLATRLGVLPIESLEAAEAQFRPLYSLYHPGYGIREHMRQNWQHYCADGKRERSA
jgi:hypothetical protein